MKVGGGAGGGGKAGPGLYLGLSSHLAGLGICGIGSNAIIEGGWQHCGEQAGAQLAWQGAAHPPPLTIIVPLCVPSGMAC